jgi:hypothetical protein
MTHANDFNLFLCIYLWRNVPDDLCDTYDDLCDKVQRSLTDEQFHELELVFGI